jgi:hypothetical protein
MLYTVPYKGFVKTDLMALLGLSTRRPRKLALTARNTQVEAPKKIYKMAPSPILA